MLDLVLENLIYLLKAIRGKKADIAIRDLAFLDKE